MLLVIPLLGFVQSFDKVSRVMSKRLLSHSRINKEFYCWQQQVYLREACELVKANPTSLSNSLRLQACNYEIKLMNYCH